VRCSISSPSADRISRVWCLVLGSLQSAVIQSPRKPMISPHCPPRPAKEGSSRWGAMPLTDTDSAGAQWMVAGYPCAPINGPLTPPSFGSDEPNSVSLSEGFYKYWECGLNGGPDISGAAEPYCLRAVLMYSGFEGPDCQDVCLAWFRIQSKSLVVSCIRVLIREKTNKRHERPEESHQLH
jgi:hypothetical protein